MSVRIFSASIQGIDAKPIEVEVDSAPGLHSFNIVGLPDKAVEESKDRIASSIRNNSLLPPSAKHKKIIINLAPADIKKEGPSYDLPIAIGYLLETQQVIFNPENKLFVGELSLDGNIKPVAGILPIAILAKKMGFKELIIPSQNAKEAAVVDGIDVVGVESIKQLISHLNGINPITPQAHEVYIKDNKVNLDSFLLIKGQESAKRALIIAAAGRHNILMSGAPGSGKTLLAKSITELLPILSFEESLEVSRIYSVAGVLGGGLQYKRPFRNPHHTTSTAAVIGGGTNPRPGEISLAHRGVLFLDELPEFRRDVLESLRQPLEDGVITVSRAAGSVHLPAKFMLIAAMNPCPCGNFGNEKANCMCSPISILNYRKKVSSPLLDRIDIQINVPRETIESKSSQTEASHVTNLISKAQIMQENRFSGTNLFSNSEISYKNIDQYCKLDTKAEGLLVAAINRRNLSLRAYHKVKKLARTIADLEGSEFIQEAHIAEALGLKINEKLFTEI